MSGRTSPTLSGHWLLMDHWMETQPKMAPVQGVDKRIVEGGPWMQASIELTGSVFMQTMMKCAGSLGKAQGIYGMAEQCEILFKERSLQISEG